MSNTSTKIANIIEQRKPLAQTIQKVEDNLHKLSFTLQNLEQYRKQLLNHLEDPQIINQLEEINLSDVDANIGSSLQALGKLKKRFSRNTLNLGVVGRARQGKSRLLQSLTGLTSAEIPDGNRQHCTGVKSIIHHNSGGNTYAEVYFHTEYSFLEEVIQPYYDKLALGNKPFTLEEFASSPLPPLSKNIPGYAEPGAMYEHLKGYHTYLTQYRQLLREPSPRVIQRGEIRDYVAQDTVDGERNLYNYLAVKEVKITCSFPNPEVDKIAIVDMPGLGDTGIGDEEKLIKSLGCDIDFILFVRMPKSSGDYWADVDVKLYDVARSALVELPIELWSFVVLNQTHPTSSNGDNLKNCQDLLNTVDQKHIRVNKTLIKNCSDTQEAGQILDNILEYLTDNMIKLDRQYAEICQQRLLETYQTVKAQITKAQKILNPDNEENQTIIEENFRDIFDTWWREIKVSLQDRLEDLAIQRQTTNLELLQGVEDALKACQEDRGILSLKKEDGLKQIQNKIKADSPYRAYPDYQDNLRLLISHKFLSLDENLKNTIEAVKNAVVDTLKKEGRLDCFSQAEGTEFFRNMAAIIPRDIVKLKAAFEIISDFKLSCREFILPRIRKYLDPLTNIYVPNNQYQNNSPTLLLSKETTAEQIWDALDIDYETVINTIRPALDELLYEPNEAAYAMVEEFIDNVVRQNNIEREWRNFLGRKRGQVWPDIFGKQEENRQRQKEWKAKIDQVVLINQVESFHFI